MGGYGNNDLTKIIVLSATTVFILTILLIQKLITIYYKQTLKNDYIKELEENLEKEKSKNRVAVDEIEVLSSINHKYSTRIDATQNYIKELTKNIDVEFSSELSIAKEKLDSLSKEFKTELTDKLNKNPKIQRTGKPGIDGIISYFENKAIKDNIDFEFKINCDIKDFIKNTVDESKIETMLGDHIKDSIIAINFENKTSNRIKVSLNSIDGIYEIAISDTGIEFEINTLTKLGKERVTTHKKTGGTGIGFMTTFEILQEVKGSLIIEEFKNSEFTKNIILRFDGKNEYKIHTYRTEEIMKKDKENRIKLKEI